MIHKDIQTIAQISIDPRFEIRDFLNELRNEWTILGKHEYYSTLSISSTNIQNFHQYLHVCGQLQETPIELLQKLCKQLARKEMLVGDDSCYFTQLSI
jgi:hypothetical protein